MICLKKYTDYDRIALMHSPLTRRHQFANKNINSVISITSWADATHGRMMQRIVKHLWTQSS